MFLFKQDKEVAHLEEDLIDNLELSVKKTPVNNYVSQEILEKEIFNNTPSFDNIPNDLDISFARSFNAKGGRFVYSSSVEDLASKLQAFLVNNDLARPFLWEDNLAKFIQDNMQSPVRIERSIDEAKCAISLCEALISDEGGLILNPNQNRFRPLANFPAIHIVLATKSQLCINLEHAVSRFLKLYPDFFPFIVDMSKEDKPTRFASNKPVLNSRGTKQIVLFYCEESIFGV